jgi:hypothetical protein
MSEETASPRYHVNGARHLCCTSKTQCTWREHSRSGISSGTLLQAGGGTQHHMLTTLGHAQMCSTMQVSVKATHYVCFSPVPLVHS